MYRVLFGILLTTLAQATANAGVIDIYGGNGYTSGPGEIDTIGQTFSASDNGSLKSFSFYLAQLSSPGPVRFRSHVYAWDGEKAAGPALYTSGLVEIFDPIANTHRYDFSTSVDVIAGNKYIAFLSSSTIPNDPGAGSALLHSGDVYTGGQIVFLHNGDDISQWTNTPWQDFRSISLDAYFHAEFSDATTSSVTEPPLSILIGVVAVGLILQSSSRAGSRNKQTA